MVARNTSAFTDDGCEYSPRCLDCPLPRCKFDEPLALRQVNAQPVLRAQRDEAIRVAAAAGVKRRTLTRKFGVSLRTVERAINNEHRYTMSAGDKPGKSLDELGRVYRQRAPWPRLPIGGRA